MNKGIQSLSDAPRDGGTCQQRARYPSTPAHKLDSVFLIVQWLRFKTGLCSRKLLQSTYLMRVVSRTGRDKNSTHFIGPCKLSMHFELLEISNIQTPLQIK